jgi:hypothetical protein
MEKFYGKPQSFLPSPLFPLLKRPEETINYSSLYCKTTTSSFRAAVRPYGI